MLEAGSLPIEDLAILAHREGTRPRPIYHAHRWFARRLGSAFRGLLTAAAIPPEADFWRAYYEGTDWSGKIVVDPFMGGGTTIIEALRLGATAFGVDIDPVAVAITGFEVSAANAPDLSPTIARLKQVIGERLAPYYRTQVADGKEVDVLHYFWVQIVTCQHCGTTSEAHPHYQLAFDSHGTNQWAFCPDCHTVQSLDRTTRELTCRPCRRTVVIEKGTVQYGRFRCPRCGAAERLIDVATRTKRCPEWRLFAVEYLEPTAKRSRRPVPLAQRHFCAITPADLELFNAACQALATRTRADGSVLGVPDQTIPVEGRADDRLIRYGYRRYRDMFNARQLLHLSLLGEEINRIHGPERESIALAFSDHLTTNCMLTSYTFGWRRAVPLFSVRAFRHITRPVEVNPWLDQTGRGTFPNAVRQVQRAIEFARSPREPLLDGGFRSASPYMSDKAARSRVVHGDARCLDFVPDDSVDLVITDPPYFDNIPYAELSDFYLSWQQLLGLIDPAFRMPDSRVGNLAAKRRDDVAASEYGRALERCFTEVRRILKPDGKLVFTYQHATARAWLALAIALATAGLQPIQVFPLLGDPHAGLHENPGRSRWDAVFVMKRNECQIASQRRGILVVADEHVAAARRRVEGWSHRLTKRNLSFGAADERNLVHAFLAAAALGLFGKPSRGAPERRLTDVLNLAIDHVPQARRPAMNEEGPCRD